METRSKTKITARKCVRKTVPKTPLYSLAEPAKRKWNMRWVALPMVIIGTTAASIAFASLTFTSTGIFGDSNGFAIDSSSTVSIGTSTATGITMGRTGQTVTFPGTVANSNVTSSLWYGTSTGSVIPLLIGSNLFIASGTLNGSG